MLLRVLGQKYDTILLNYSLFSAAKTLFIIKIFNSNNTRLKLSTLYTRLLDQIQSDDKNGSTIRRLLSKKRSAITSGDLPPDLKLKSFENFVHGLEASFKRYRKPFGSKVIQNKKKYAFTLISFQSKIANSRNRNQVRTNKMLKKC